MAAAVLLFVCVNEPPTVLYWPEKLTPVVRWMTTVIDTAVSVAVLSMRSASSLKKGVFELTRGVGVTTPPVGFTVRLIEVVWLGTPVAVPVTVTVAGPRVAVAAAVNVRVLVAPVAGFALKVAVTPVGRPVAARVTPAAKPPVRLMLMVLAAVDP